MQHMRVDHDPQRELLQVHQLRHDQRLRVDGVERDLPCHDWAAQYI